jgi:WD domain, G-beta repeat
VTAWAERGVLTGLDTGVYMELDRSAALVRSTISIAFSGRGRYFASTHGDHTVKVFEYPSGRQVAFLEGHPRTPWTVRFHPLDERIVATGCLGNEVRVWDHAAGRCVRKHRFASSISCVSFSPDGGLLAVTSGNSLVLWDWTAPPPPPGGDGRDWNLHRGAPRELLRGTHPFYCCDFHPSGRLIMCGEKNKLVSTHPDANPGSDEQFTLRVVVHRFDRRVGIDFEHPLLVVPRVVAYNDAGIHFSPCGTMLAACIPGLDAERVFRIAVLSLTPRPGGVRVGDVLYEASLDAGRTIALTNLKFSPSSTHLLAGYSFRQQNPVLRVHAEHYSAVVALANAEHARERVGGVWGVGGAGGGAFARERHLPSPPQISVVDIYELADNKRLNIRRQLTADVDVSPQNVGAAQDEINVAVFAPCELGYALGVCYGSQKGRIRMFQQFSGSVEATDEAMRLGVGFSGYGYGGVDAGERRTRSSSVAVPHASLVGDDALTLGAGADPASSEDGAAAATGLQGDGGGEPMETG